MRGKPARHRPQLLRLADGRFGPAGATRRSTGAQGRPPGRGGTSPTDLFVVGHEAKTRLRSLVSCKTRRSSGRGSRAAAHDSRRYRRHSPHGPIYLPSTGSHDWQWLLASPGTHWKHGASAMALADAWEHADGWPAAVEPTLASDPELSELEPLLALPEHAVPLPGGSRPSQTDLFVLARRPDEQLVAIAVEGKAEEPFETTPLRSGGPMAARGAQSGWGTSWTHSVLQTTSGSQRSGTSFSIAPLRRSSRRVDLGRHMPRCSSTGSGRMTRGSKTLLPSSRCTARQPRTVRRCQSARSRT